MHHWRGWVSEFSGVFRSLTDGQLWQTVYQPGAPGGFMGCRGEDVGPVLLCYCIWEIEA